jgi:4-hydroxybenzoate polyprenyltransferase
MKRSIDRAHDDAGRARRLLSGARRRARARAVSLYVLLVVVGVVAALMALAALLAFLGRGD